MAVDPLSSTFAALADPTRRAILARLAEGEATLKELAEPFAMSLQAVSRHLKVLERAGLITRGRSAQWRPCRLDSAPLEGAAEWIGRYRQFWGGNFDRLEDHLREIQKGGTTVPETASTPPAVRREFTITRVLDAPRELVFQAWTDPTHLARWFGPHGFATPEPTISVDLRPGGLWRQTMVADAGGSEYPVEMVYHEVVEPERLVFAWGNAEDPSGRTGAAVVTVTFTDVAGKTEMSFHQTGLLPAEADATVLTGWSESFDRLAAYLVGYHREEGN